MLVIAGKAKRVFKIINKLAKTKGALSEVDRTIKGN